jgi:CheY-like chemotaxis protein
MEKSILIAAAQRVEITDIIKAFQNYGYLVTSTNDGDEVLRLIGGQKNLIAVVMDSTLKGIGTLEICKKIKESRRLFKIPILVLEDENINKQEYRKIGVKGIIEKPFYSSSMLQMIENLTACRGVVVISKPKFKQQLIGIAILITISLTILTYFVFIPMIVGLTQNKDKAGIKQTEN